MPPGAVSTGEGEELFRIAFENAPFGMSLVAPDGRYLAVNPALCAMFGYAREELLGGTIDLVTHPADIERSRLWIQQVIAGTGDGAEIEKRYLHRDGHVVWGRVRASWIREPDGTPRFSVVHIEDITERKRGEEERREAHLLNEQLITGAQEGIVVYGPDLHYRIWNPYMEQLTGVAAGAALGRHPLEVFPFLKPTGLMPRLERALAGERSGAFDFPFPVEINGQTRWISDSIAPLRNGQGEVTGVIAMVRDVTEHIIAQTAAEASLRAEKDLAQLYLGMAEVMIVAFDAAARITVLNRKGYAVLGYEDGELVGRDWFEVCLPPEECAAVRAVFCQMMTGNVEPVEYFENRIVRKDGERRLIAWHNTALRDPAGVIIGTISSGEDITDSRKAEEELRRGASLLRTLLDTIPDLVWLKDAGGVYLACNPRFERFFGAREQEIAGRTDRDFVDPAQADAFRAMDLEAMARGRAVSFEEEVTFADDGHRERLETVRTPIFDSAGAIIGALGIGRDITERKRVEETLRESNRRLELAITSGCLGIWELDLVEGTQVWNDRMYQLYGLEPRPVHPDHAFWCRHIVHPDDLQAADAAIAAAFAGTRPYDLEFRIRRPDGEIRTIKSDGHVLRDAQGRAVRVIGINRDRTREVEAEAERRRLQAELLHAEKLESIGSLAGGVAHDMNNVLAAILGMASTLEADPQSPVTRAKALDTIVRACTRGRDVVKSLLYFARKDLETTGPVDLNGVAAEMVHLLSFTTLKRVEIRTEFQEPLPLIEGDGGALSHALINLCVNAVDAMPGGGTLEVRTRQRGEWGVEISIKDSGIGMSPQVVRSAVEPFFTTKPAGKGTGLGLAMVYGTVKAHHGTFEIRSAEGQGTEVILGFPRPAQAAAAAPDAPAGAAARPASGPLRILLVDDDELIRDSVAPMIGVLGHAVQTAESGQEALDLFQAGLEADLVILDMNMPGLNGAQTLSRLLELRPNQAVLMATGYSEESITPLLEGRPRVASLRKPFSFKEFQSKLASMAVLG